MSKFINYFESMIRSGLGAPILLVVILGMMIVPLPAFLLDLLFTFNIVLALIILMSSIYAKRPLDFATFPTVILIATLLRLALNLASTRIVLLEGHQGGDAAGKVIESFGNFVVGGNFAIGLIIFAILVLINFVVVTKGTGRVAEVSARFTLDAMPGKQMAIDADLAAGVISQDEAKQRREDVVSESDFYGSMDGASKFVKGDAIAGLLILFINIVGGLFVGIVQHNLSFDIAMEYYVLLTIGDGLVAQIPGLLLSTATAIIVTRVSSSNDMGSEIFSQLGKPQGLLIAAGIVGFLGLIPGMPNFPFLLMSSVFVGLYYYQRKVSAKKEIEAAKEESKPKVEPPKELSWDDIPLIDQLSLEVGYRLIPMVDQSQNGELLKRIKGIRKKLSTDLGFLVPTVHVKDNLDLLPNEYKIMLMGVPVGTGVVHPDRSLAINPGQVFGELSGEKTTEPAYGLEAVWIDSDDVDKAQTQGYTVADSSTVIATHISKILQENAHELLGRDEVQQIIDRVGKKFPKLVDGLLGDNLPLGTVVNVFQNLLEEGVPIVQAQTILETLADHSLITKDTEELTALARVSQARYITTALLNGSNELPLITLSPGLEQILNQAVSTSNESGQLSIEPKLAENIQIKLSSIVEKSEMAGESPVLVVNPGLRRLLAGFLKHVFNDLPVLSFSEIPPDTNIKLIDSLG